jgi:hypothetical protein
MQRKSWKNFSAIQAITAAQQNYLFDFAKI